MTTPKVDNVKTVGTPDFNRNADGQKKKEDTKNDSKKREKLKKLQIQHNLVYTWCYC
ncbi:hypothetical protein ACT7DM_26975 [Bacillus cereus]